jgi:hypothetical protein
MIKSVTVREKSEKRSPDRLSKTAAVKEFSDLRLGFFLRDEQKEKRVSRRRIR